MGDVGAILRAVECGRLFSTVDEEGYCILMWRGIGKVNKTEAMRLVDEWDLNIRAALVHEAQRFALEIATPQGNA